MVDVNSTRQQAVSRAAETLRLSDEKALLGVAVNRVRDRGAGYYYYYYYYQSYSGYYAPDES